MPERPRGFGWRVSIPAELSFQLWGAMVRLKHAVGRHTFIDVELWEDDPLKSITIVAQECWLCPKRK